MSSLDKFRLDGKVALITGAGKGIGAAIAKAFAEAGAHVALGARTESDLADVAAYVEAQGQQALVQPTDVMKPEQMQALVDAALERFGQLDILVNNAGGYPPMPALSTTTEQLMSALEFNVGTAFRLSTLCAQALAERNGSIINISSIAGEAATPCFAAYGTAKSALSFLTRQLAQEFAPKIRVNAIGVGSTKTDALNTVLTDEIEKTMVELTPMARLGEVEDIALGAVYLASPAASYITGEILGINGGLERANMQMPRAFGGVG
ncbi:MAG: glucose 1-dehydrogenase [Pseudomonadota bacterium]